VTYNFPVVNENFGISLEMRERIKEFRKEWYKKIQEVAEEKTPQFDGTGKEIIKDKGTTGYKYIEETYMRDALDRHFPGWSCEMAAPLYFLSAEWVVAQVHLRIIDENLIAFGIVPPLRTFYGVDSVRIQYKQGQPHNPENLVDIGDNCKQAETAALKYAINRLTRIGDDVYGKRVEFEGSGTRYDLLVAHPTLATFLALCNDNSISIATVTKALGISGIAEIKNIGISLVEAWEKVLSYIKEQKGTSKP